MSIMTDGSGRRSVSVAVELPGTIEEAWQAVATGAGISAWFVPSDLQIGFDGLPVRMIHHGGFTSSASVEIKDWDPPRSFSTLTEDLAPDAPPMQTCWTLQPLGPLGCRLEVEHSVPTPLPDWDHLLLKAERGWTGFFGILSVYLGHFAGKRCAACILNVTTRVTLEKAWENLTEPLGLSRPALGERFKSEPDAPVLAGVIEATADGEHPHGLILRIDDPVSAAAHLFATPQPFGRTGLCLRLYFYGDQAVTTLGREEPQWQAWLSELFPDASG